MGNHLARCWCVFIYIRFIVSVNGLFGGQQEGKGREPQKTCVCVVVYLGYPFGFVSCITLGYGAGLHSLGCNIGQWDMIG